MYAGFSPKIYSFLNPLKVVAAFRRDASISKRSDLSVLQATRASLNQVWTGLINLIRRLKSFGEKVKHSSLKASAATTRRRSIILYRRTFLMEDKLVAENMNNVDPNTRLPLPLPAFHSDWLLCCGLLCCLLVSELECLLTGK